MALLSSALRSLRRFLPPAASCSPLILLLLDYCYLPVAILGVRLLIFSLIETSVAIAVVVVVVVVVVRSGVVEVGVALQLAPVQTIGSSRLCRLLLLP